MGKRRKNSRASASSEAGAEEAATPAADSASSMPVDAEQLEALGQEQHAQTDKGTEQHIGRTEPSPVVLAVTTDGEVGGATGKGESAGDAIDDASRAVASGDASLHEVGGERLGGSSDGAQAAEGEGAGEPSETEVPDGRDDGAAEDAAPPPGPAPQDGYAYEYSGEDYVQAAEAELPDPEELVREISEVAGRTVEAAQDVADKITNDLSELGNELSSGAGAFVSSLSSWFGAAVEPEPEATAMQTHQATPERAPAQAAPPSRDEQRVLVDVFGLSPSERVIEAFPAKLVQTYTCSHNDYTPDIQMAFAGTMYVTDRHTAFNVEERGRKLPLVVEHAQIARVERQRARDAGAGDTLRVVLSTDDDGDDEGEEPLHITFGSFPKGELESCLGLLEHLTSSSTDAV